jgi:uncharacterized membrane protein YkvA (DUF1232 family)
VLNLVVAALAIAVGFWLLFVVVLVIARPRGRALGEGMRMLPDTFRLVRRLTTDATVPRSARVLVWVLLGYLVLPIDLIPDFIPVIGFADDLILAALVLGYVVRRAGPEVLERQWPGTPEGLAALRTLLRFPT